MFFLPDERVVKIVKLARRNCSNTILGGVPIDIIKNTRGGIVISLQSKKGNAAIVGQKIKTLK